MRRVIASAFVSLDGVIQAPGGPEEDRTGGFGYGGWVFPYFDDQLGEAMSAILDRSYDLLLGRKTYEIFAAHWPYIANDPIADRFNKTTKYVATRGDLPLEWANSVAVRGDVPREIAGLKEGKGPDLLIQGSSLLVQSLLANRLIDELTLLTFPLLLGRGKKLFADDAVPGALEAQDIRTSSKGVVIARYRPAGPIETGSFVPDSPSQAEIERRDRWQQED